MKAFSRIAPLVAVLLSACVSRAPAPAPAPVPRPVPALPAAPVGEDWRDIPLTPGTWSYRPVAGGSIAQYGPSGGTALFAVRCDASARRILLSRGTGRYGAAAQTLRFVTSFGEFAFSVNAPAGQPPATVAVVAAADPRLDKLAFSRGRFIVTLADEPRLVIPAWPEIARVVEDCRG